jgi:hypothetical protein
LADRSTCRRTFYTLGGDWGGDFDDYVVEFDAEGKLVRHYFVQG